MEEESRFLGGGRRDVFGEGFPHAMQRRKRKANSGGDQDIDHDGDATIGGDGNGVVNADRDRNIERDGNDGDVSGRGSGEIASRCRR